MSKFYRISDTGIRIRHIPNTRVNTIGMWAIQSQSLAGFVNFSPSGKFIPKVNILWNTSIKKSPQMITKGGRTHNDFSRLIQV
jgi:hypothetical protein